MEKNNESEITSAVDLFGKSSKLIRNNLNVVWLLYLLPAMSLVAGMRPQEQADKNEQFSMFFSRLNGFNASALAGLGAVALVFVVLNIVVSLMTVAAEVRMAQADKFSLSTLWQDTKKFGPRLIGFGFGFVGLLLIGFIALIIPGFIVLRRYLLTPYIIIDQDMGIKDAMAESKRLSEVRSTWDIWSVLLMSLVLSLISTAGRIGQIVSFILTTLYSVAFAIRYQELKKFAKNEVKQ